MAWSGTPQCSYLSRHYVGVNTRRRTKGAPLAWTVFVPALDYQITPAQLSWSVQGRAVSLRYPRPPTIPPAPLPSSCSLTQPKTYPLLAYAYCMPRWQQILKHSASLLLCV